MTPFYPATLPEMTPEELSAKLDVPLTEAVKIVQEMDNQMVFMNETHQVNVTKVQAPFGPAQGDMLWLSIKRRDKSPIHDWRELQTIKNMIVGPEHEGMELYPRESRLVDTANQFHLHVFMKEHLSFPVGWRDRAVVQKADPKNGSVQREFVKTVLDRIDAADEALHALTKLIPNDKLAEAFALADTIKQGLAYYQGNAMKMKGSKP